MLWILTDTLSTVASTDWCWFTSPYAWNIQSRHLYIVLLESYWSTISIMQTLIFNWLLLLGPKGTPANGRIPLQAENFQSQWKQVPTSHQETFETLCPFNPVCSHCVHIEAFNLFFENLWNLTSAFQGSDLTQELPANKCSFCSCRQCLTRNQIATLLGVLLGVLRHGQNLTA